MRWIKKIILFRSESGSLAYEILRKFTKHKFPRILLNRTNPLYFNHSARRINQIIGKNSYSYLEIGVASGTTLQCVKAVERYGVDPLPSFNVNRLPDNLQFFKMTSDEFFTSLKPETKFDFIFLDGLHEFDQLLKDFVNSLKHIKSGGWILIDDVVPSDSISAIPNIETSYFTRGVGANEGYPWHGDVYKILPVIFENFSELESFLIIYPDNPQLLVKVNKNFSHIKVDVDSLKIQYENIEYFEVFSRQTLKKFPIYIEEILFKELKKLQLINE
jgi:hypothetical protein